MERFTKQNPFAIRRSPWFNSRWNSATTVRLSVFWGSVTSLSGVQPGGRFPPLDRLDLIKHGRLLAGSDVRGNLPAPTHEELMLAGAEFALRRLDTDEIIGKPKNPEGLAQSDPKTLTKLVLFPIRFMFTARTGEVGRNEAAVEHSWRPRLARRRVWGAWHLTGAMPKIGRLIRARCARLRRACSRCIGSFC